MIKKTPGKIYLNCRYIPPEIFVAAGIEPYRPWPAEINNRQRGLLPYDLCPYSRSFLSAQIEDNACAVYATSCDGMRRAYDATDNSHILEIPRIFTKENIDYYYEQLIMLLYKLDIDYKQTEYKKKLIKAINEFNQQRYLLQKLQQQLNKYNNQSFCMLVRAITYHYSQNKEAIKNLIKKIIDTDNRIFNSNQSFKPRILISSSCLLDNSLVKLVSSKDLLLTGLDSCLGERTFNFQVNLDDDNPLYSLARDYLTGPVCPRMMSPERRLQELSELVKKRQVDGIIYFIPKFCDQAIYDFKLIHDNNIFNLPILRIEGEYQAGDSGQLDTRITAFKESLMIKNKRNWLHE